jgi:hypothetical protein
MRFFVFGFICIYKTTPLWTHDKAALILVSNLLSYSNLNVDILPYSIAILDCVIP